jgi:RimJ/RimL family protein N-acetyltransferase
VERAFAQGLSEVVAVVTPGNDASVRVAQRVGLHHEGLTDRYYGQPMELFRLVSPLTEDASAAD